ncbi:HAMP domain-containing sensor histidine kinase [Sulfuricurvum sp. RIFCSPLOWO2_12_FULL_43_24]|uniref:sensor histidine kinase n=1 Tax=Sulfuricurvum sp. RIFCSPLOWO2_12_FULL_43_24 TaxID=1802247 RepID=UPI0008CE4473|nr:HAMP domain-containing sensor histidine kinase [Sulfuricurvum sp. RIFCSPLOWO2_12_FULL_43_24]OHD86873.1 MAG: two-component sensor histidine kinase [Sulfuricurvum sp. RIFCSPLOWO2_02_43_6]OHD89512.1 MAG: two-component sensor histidine kinase [Sulfuricurvum sp. RIFCSPLOWO2_12_FULL_43_24]
MLRIHQLFFLNVLGLFIAALFVASLISYFTLKSMIIHDGEERLIENINLLEPLLTTTQDFDRFVAQAAGRTFLRVTVIDESGEVIAESDADKETMENHAGRVEVMHAMTEPYGVAVRYSNTIKTDFIYVAHKINTPDKTFYIRLAMSLEGVMDHFYALWIQLVGAFGALIILALIIAYKISKKARFDILQITNYLDQISAKNYRAVLKPEYFREFLQISIMLKNLVKKLNNRDKQKRKHTAKLRLINKQQNDILSAISHEFKNPIAAIMGYAETLHDDLSLDPKIREKFLDKILSNTHRVTLMLDRLALSVKLENNDLSIKPTLFELSDVCLDSISILQAKYSDRSIRYVGISKTVFADKTMIELILTNLIDNALKYSEEEVTVTLTDTTVSISDKGIGIASSELDKITSKFYRVQKNRWDNSMGLGLSIVSYILKLHDTELRIESTQGVGSTFSFSLANLIEQKKITKK